MYCKNCGRKLEDGDRFCSKCGTPVSAPAQENDFLKTLESFREEKKTPEKKPFHMEDMKWDLSGFPVEELPKTDDIDFNWSSVIEERDRHLYRGYEEKPADTRADDILEELEKPAPGKASFDWGLGATMRIERPSDTIKREEAARKAAEEAREKVETTEEIETAEPAHHENITEPEKEEPDTVPDLNELVNEPLADSSRRIDKFYTFNKKNEEFQALLDQEYERLRQRIREESEAEASFQEKYDRLQKARDEWNKQEILRNLAEENKSSGGAAVAAIGGVMAAVDKIKNRPNRADDEVDGLDDYVITDLFTEEKDEDKPETSETEELKPEAEIGEETRAEVQAEESLQEAENNEEPSEESEETAEEESGEAEEKTEEAETEAEGTEKEPDKASEEQDEKASETVEAETDTCPPSTEEESEEVTEDESCEEAGTEDDKGEDEKDGSEVAPVALFDDGDDFDDEDAKEHKKGKALNVIIGILVVIVILNLAAVGILMLAPDSAPARYINEGYNKVISLFKGEDAEEPAPASVDVPEEEELTGTAALVDAEKNMAPNISTLQADTGLLIPSNLYGKIGGLEDSEPFVDMAWFTDEDGNTVNYGNAVVGKVLEHFSHMVDTRNEEMEENVTFDMTTLVVGEIRQYENHFYVMTETNEVTSDSSDAVTGRYVVHLIAEDKTVTVEEVIDTLEEK